MKKVIYIFLAFWLLFFLSCNQYRYSSLTLYQYGNSYWRTFAWTYGRHSFISTVFIPIGTYNYYHSLSKTQPYSEYVIEQASHPYLKEVCQTLYNNIEDYHFSDQEIQEYLLCFVQSIPYAYDPPGLTGYPRYAAETLAEDEGDCKSHSILYLTLLTAFGYRGILVEPPGHLAVGLACNWCNGSYVELSGVRYYYAETTAPGWAIGQLPDRYMGAHPIIFTVMQTASFRRPVAVSNKGYRIIIRYTE